MALLGTNPLAQLLGQEQMQQAETQALNMGALNAIAQLLAASGPQAKPVSTGQAIGSALLGGVSGYQSSMDKTLSDMLKTAQVSELLNKQKLKEVQQKALQVATTTMQPAVIPEGQTLYDEMGEVTYGSQAPKAVPSTFNADIYKTYALRLGVDPKDIGSTIEAMKGKTTTVKPGEVVLGEDMKPIYTAPKETKFQSIDTPQGVMVFNPDTGGYTPARDASGQPIMGTQAKAPQKFTDSVVNIKNMRSAVTDYLNDLSSTDPRYVFPGSKKAAELGTKFTNLQMQLKNLYELGAITGPDLTLLNNAITDPTSMLGRYKGKESLEKQVDVITNVLAKNEKNLYETYKQPIPKNLENIATPRSPQEALGLTIPSGVTVRKVK